MKNYELVSRLMKLPAGADVRFWGTREKDDISYDEEGLATIISDITDVDIDSLDMIIDLM